MRAFNLLTWLIGAVLLTFMAAPGHAAIWYDKCTGTGQVASATVGGVPGRYWSSDALCGGFTFFPTTGYNANFPAIVNPCAGTSDPRGKCIDLAYSKPGTLSWLNVKVPTAGRYTLDFKYAFAKGLFPALADCERPEALKVNGVQVINTIHFMRTAGGNDFTAFTHKLVVVELKAGANTVELYNNGSDHAISRLDYMIVTATTNPLTPLNGGPTLPCLFP